MAILHLGRRTFDLRRAEPAEIVDLRWRILRGGLPRSEAIFSGDEHATSFHYLAAEIDADSLVKRVVCCATFHLNEWKGKPAYQLRGMATEPDFRGLGLGRGLLELADADVYEKTPVRMLWCNARTPAIGFYEKQGWSVRSEVFEIPTAGPHVQMDKLLSR